MVSVGGVSEDLQTGSPTRPRRRVGSGLAALAHGNGHPQKSLAPASHGFGLPAVTPQWRVWQGSEVNERRESSQQFLFTCAVKDQDPRGGT